MIRLIDDLEGYPMDIPLFLLSRHDSRIMYRNSLELSVVSNFVLKG